MGRVAEAGMSSQVSMQCTQGTRNSSGSFRANLAAQGNVFLHGNKAASQVLDLFVRYLTSAYKISG